MSVNKKSSQFALITETDETTLIPLIQGAPLGNKIITPEDLFQDLVEEAPVDGTAYAREDEAWVPIPGGGDMLKSVYDTDNNGIVDNSELLDGETKEEIIEDLVPYTGAISDVDLGIHSVKATTVVLYGLDDLGAPIEIPITFSQTERTVEIQMQNVTGQVFEELFIDAKCSGIVRNGYPAQFIGSQGGHIVVKEANMAEVGLVM
jgi:hypothetical protein